MKGMKEKYFPIHIHSIYCGTAHVYHANGVWYLQFIRDDRFGPVYTMAEIARFVTTADPQHAMLLAKIGYVAKAIEDFTSVPLASLPRPVQHYGFSLIRNEERNPFLRFVTYEIHDAAGVRESNIVADFMLPQIRSGKININEAHSSTPLLFTCTDNGTVKLIGNCDISWCVFAGNNTIKDSSAAFCGFANADVDRHSVLHNCFVFRNEDGDTRVCH